MCILHGNKYEQSCRRFDSFECCACCIVKDCKDRVHDLDMYGSRLVSLVSLISNIVPVKLEDRELVLKFLQDGREVTVKEEKAIRGILHIISNNMFMFETAEKELTNDEKDSYHIPKDVDFGYNDFDKFSLQLVGKNWLNMRRLCNKDGVFRDDKPFLVALKTLDSSDSERYDLYLDEYIFSRIEDRATPSILFNITMSESETLTKKFFEDIKVLLNEVKEYIKVNS